MNDKPLSRFETLKLASENWIHTDLTSILIIIFFILAVIIIFVGGLLMQKFLKTKHIHNYFFKYAEDKGLTEKEAKILWDYSKRMGRDPLLVIEFKSPFEKVVDLYIHTHPNPDEKLVQDMRKKLGFNVIYNFIPLTLSKDIEMFQNGKMITGKKAYDVALYDKDEKHMYWLIIGLKSRSEIDENRPVKITFLRKGDAIYNLESPITEVLQEDNKIVVKLPHTFEMSRTQRREFPRIETDIPAMIGDIITVDGKEEIVWHIGRILDISVGGVKFCIPKDGSKEIKTGIGQNVLLKFELENNSYDLKASIENKDERKTAICLGLKFTDIKEKEKEKIFEYIQKEQKKLAQLARSQKQ
ncbi:flagellar brake protein [Nitrosophilus alvini]|uniref:flagellar brake protein n=1 Tax=Nitrosophilus alvini TaxID=2714855 RepID=UPI00190C675E|nr:PilZ domain-containing protein [Nitrosophilus alvini]